MKVKHMKNKQQNQQGIVSIVVTMILMIVITLMVLSFAKISRREQRNALDRQLSTQAFLAAESGINDTINELKEWDTGDVRWLGNYMQSCTDLATSFVSVATETNVTTPTTISGLNNAAYTCIFVDPTPPQIKFAKSLDEHIFPLEAASGGNLDDINIQWDDETFTNSFFADCLVSPFLFTIPVENPETWGTECHAGPLRVELVDASNVTVSKVFYIFPSIPGSGSLDFTASNTGSIMYGNCDTARAPKCQARITLGAQKYYMRIKSLYIPSQLVLSSNVGGVVEDYVGAQAVIDVTARATDVLRRLQVRVKANNLSGGSLPSNSLQGVDQICKKFSISTTLPIDDGNCSPPGGFPD